MSGIAATPPPKRNEKRSVAGANNTIDTNDANDASDLKRFS